MKIFIIPGINFLFSISNTQNHYLNILMLLYIVHGIVHIYDYMMLFYSCLMWWALNLMDIT